MLVPPASVQAKPFGQLMSHDSTQTEVVPSEAHLPEAQSELPVQAVPRPPGLSGPGTQRPSMQVMPSPQSAGFLHGSPRVTLMLAVPCALKLS